MDATLRQREEELHVLRFQHVQCLRKQKQLIDDQAKLSASEHRTDLAGRALRVLASFEQRLLSQKLEQLRVEFVRCFNRLARKGDIAADVRVNPDTFAVTLIDKNGGEIPKASLSAGEKQVYAVAILWALARTSGRALPMIIDTPLARLDSEHRGNLVNRYFPS